MKWISDYAETLIDSIVLRAWERGAYTDTVLGYDEEEEYVYQKKEVEQLMTYIASLEAENRALRHALELRECEEKQRWIPVSERLPDNWKPVMTIDMSESTRVPVPAFYDPETSLWSTHLPNYDLLVTHWMPLPEPPIVCGKESREQNG